MPAKNVIAKSKASATRKPAPSPKSKPAPTRAAKPATARPSVSKPSPTKPSPAALKAKPAKALASTKAPASKAPSAKSRSRSFLAGLDAAMTAADFESRKPLSAKARADKRQKKQPVDTGPAHEFAIEAARLIRDDKCEDVVVLDVRGMSQITDYVVIGSGTSERQMRSILQHVEEIGATRGFQAFRTNTDDRASWVLVDFVDVVVHLFEPNTRAHYDLENLWPDANRVPWERPDQIARDRAGLHA